MSQFKWLISNDYLHLWRNGKLSANKALKLTGCVTQLIAMLGWMYVASNYILSDYIWVKQHSRKVSTAECTRQAGTATTWAHLTSYIPTAAECIPNLNLPLNVMTVYFLSIFSLFSPIYFQMTVRTAKITMILTFKNLRDTSWNK